MVFCLFIGLFIYSLFIKNSYLYIRANLRQLPNVEKMKSCKLNINKKKKTCIQLLNHETKIHQIINLYFT